jgi:RNA polymerase sigma-70 factor (ECF subfamily)
MDDLITDLGEAGSHLDRPSRRREEFSTTLWSVVLGAGNHDYEKATAALQRLCSIYWYPIYAFIRRRGSPTHEAEDLTQAFFEHLLQRQTLMRVDQSKGRFRSFLLAALTNFLNNEWDKRQTLKRGGKRQVVSLDEATVGGLYLEEFATNLPPEMMFDRLWASTLVEKALKLLREEYQTATNAPLLERLQPMLTQEIPDGLYVRLAAEFNAQPGAVKVALHRLRRRFGELLRREVALTLADRAALDGEVRYLLSVISV